MRQTKSTSCYHLHKLSFIQEKGKRYIFVFKNRTSGSYDTSSRHKLSRNVAHPICVAGYASVTSIKGTSEGRHGDEGPRPFCRPPPRAGPPAGLHAPSAGAACSGRGPPSLVVPVVAASLLLHQRAEEGRQETAGQWANFPVRSAFASPCRNVKEMATLTADLRYTAVLGMVQLDAFYLQAARTALLLTLAVTPVLYNRSPAGPLGSQVASLRGSPPSQVPGGLLLAPPHKAACCTSPRGGDKTPESSYFAGTSCAGVREQVTLRSEKLVQRGDENDDWT